MDAAVVGWVCECSYGVFYAIGSLALAAFVWVLTVFTGSFRPNFENFRSDSSAETAQKVAKLRKFPIFCTFSSGKVELKSLSRRTWKSASHTLAQPQWNSIVFLFFSSVPRWNSIESLRHRKISFQVIFITHCVTLCNPFSQKNWTHLSSDLVSALSGLNMNDFTHFVGFFLISYKRKI
jgi:hypothetical protein